MTPAGKPVSPVDSRPAFGSAEEEEAAWLIRRAIEEDLPSGDATSEALFPGDREPGVGAGFTAISREVAVLCGLPVVTMLYAELDRGVAVRPRKRDGELLARGEVFLEIEGPPASVLRGERIALNFLQRLSGVATTTSRWARNLEGLDVTLLDTRKTTPGWRRLEKYAVRAGGGSNHRRDLSEGFLLKDNHVRLLRAAKRGSYREWVQVMRAAGPEKFLEVEVDTRDDFLEALDAGVDAILLDNFSLDDLRWAVGERRARSGDRPLLEASGGIRFDRVRAVAETGVDRISAGALTHSAGVIDMSFEYAGEPPAGDR